jgi:hypothetical protein
MKVLLLGAGASRGTFRFERTPVPVSAEFGEVLTNIEPEWFKEYPDLPKVVAHLGLNPVSWSLEDVWGCVDYYSKFYFQPDRDLSILEKPPIWARPGDVKKALLDVFGKRCDIAAEQLPVDQSYTLGALLADLQPEDLLVSFNYDTVAERVARKFGHELRSVESTVANARRGPSFAKPHGSCSWLMFDDDRTVRSTEHGGPILDSLVSGTLRSGENPLVLGAVPIKTELIREVQTACDTSGRSWRSIFVTVAAQWRAVVEAIGVAEKVVSVGYSFPADDSYGRFLFREALRDRRGSPVIEFFERRDRAADRAGDIMRVFRCHAEELRYRGPVEPAP